MKNREEARQSRAELHEANERKRLRSSHGERLVKVIVEVTGMNFSLEDFQGGGSRLTGHLKLHMPPDLLRHTSAGKRQVICSGVSETRSEAFPGCWGFMAKII